MPVLAHQELSPSDHDAANTQTSIWEQRDHDAITLQGDGRLV